MLRSSGMSRSRPFAGWSVAALVCCWTLCSCEGGHAPLLAAEAEAQGEGEISIHIPLSKPAAANISRAEVVVTATGMTEIRQDLTVDGNSISGAVRGIPAGADRVFTINGYNASGSLTYTGFATATVTAGQQVTVTITVRSVAVSAGSPQLAMRSTVSAQRTYVGPDYRTTITGEITNSGTADATGIVIRFRARSSGGAPIGDATANVGTVRRSGSALFTASFSNTDNFDWQSRYVARADYTVSYNEGTDLTGSVTVQ